MNRNISHQQFGTMVAIESYQPCGNTSQCLRSGRFGFSGTSNWLGLKAAAERAVIKKYMATTESHDKLLAKYVLLGKHDGFYKWNALTLGTWRPKIWGDNPIDNHF